MKLIRFLLQCTRGVRYSKITIFFAIVMGIVCGLINTALLATINAALNSSPYSRTTLLQTFAALCLLLPLIRLVSESLLIRLTAWGIFNLRMQLSRRIVSTPLRKLEELGAHRVLATLTEDIPVITNALASVPIICMHSAIVVGCLIYVGWLSWSVLLGVCGFMVLGLITYQLPLMRAVRHLRFAREHSDALFRHFRALTEGMKELKLQRTRREFFLSQTLQSTAAALRRHQFAGNMIYNATRSWGQVLIFILIGLLIFAAPNVLNVNAQILTGYILVLLYMMTPLEMILNLIPIFGRANVAVQKVENLGLTLTSEPVSRDLPLDSDGLNKWHTLELEGVTHTYYREGENDNFTLGPMNLTFKPGELVFLSGGNGSGKTTLAKVITGLYKAEAGTLRLDGQCITDELKDSYRQHFSVVFSDFFLFESLLGLNVENLDAKARHYLVQLQLQHKVQVKEGMLSTTDLSQGQRKRLALLNAYLQDRPFYVFDEWAADQDPLFKEIFYLDLLPKLKARGKTVLVITHDHWYFHVADRLIRLEYGQLESDEMLHSAPAQPNELALALPLGRASLRPLKTTHT